MFILSNTARTTTVQRHIWTFLHRITFPKQLSLTLSVVKLHCGVVALMFRMNRILIGPEFQHSAVSVSDTGSIKGSKGSAMIHGLPHRIARHLRVTLPTVGLNDTLLIHCAFVCVQENVTGLITHLLRFICSSGIVDNSENCFSYETSEYLCDHLLMLT